MLVVVMVDVRFWVADIFSERLPLVTVLKFVLGMVLREVDVLDWRARRKVISKFAGFRLRSEDLDRMVDVETELHLRVEDDLVLTSKPLLYALSR